MISDSLIGREGEEISFLQRLDIHVFDKVAQLNDRDPLLILCLASVSSKSLAWPQLRPQMWLPNPLWKPQQGLSGFQAL